MKIILMTQTVVYPTHGVRALQYNEGREVTVPDEVADVFLNNGQATLVRVEVPEAPVVEAPEEVVEAPEEKAVPGPPENKAVGADETKASEAKSDEDAGAPHDPVQAAAPVMADAAHEAQTT